MIKRDFWLTYISFTSSTMHRTDQWRSILGTPRWLWQIIGLLLLVFQRVFDRTGDLLHLLWSIESIHQVILVSHLIRQTTRPCLDLVELEFLFVVPRFADIHLFI